MAKGVHVDSPSQETTKTARARARNRRRYLSGKYGITQADYLRLLAEQKGKCAICGRVSIDLHIDHDHESGQIRGLLCMTCNTALGGFKDNTEWLIAAARYVSRAWLATQRERKDTL